MRKVAGCLLLACAAFAQTSAPDKTAQNDKITQTKAMVEAFRQRIKHLNPVRLLNLPTAYRLQGTPIISPTVCAIPLLNVTPPGTSDRIPIIMPPAPSRQTGDTVKVPAPACNDSAFRSLPQLQVAPQVP